MLAEWKRISQVHLSKCFHKHFWNHSIHLSTEAWFCFVFNLYWSLSWSSTSPMQTETISVSTLKLAENRRIHWDWPKPMSSQWCKVCSCGRGWSSSRRSSSSTNCHVRLLLKLFPISKLHKRKKIFHLQSNMWLKQHQIWPPTTSTENHFYYIKYVDMYTLLLIQTPS